MKEKFTRLLNVKPEDISKLVYLLLLLETVTVGVILGSIATNSLFVVKFGVDKLPYMYMLTAIVSVMFSVWFFAVSKQIPRVKLFLACFGSFVVMIFLCRFMAGINFIEKSIWFYPLLFIITGIISMVTPIVFWLVSNDLCNAREAKRLFPLVLGGSQVGVIAVCFSIKYIVDSIGTKNMFLLWGGCLILSILVFLRIYSKFNNLFVLTSVSEKEKTPISFRALKHNFSAVVKRSPFVKYLAASIILMTILNNSLSFNFYSIVKEVYPDVDKFAIINGIIKGVSSVLILFLQLFVTGRVIAWLGIGITLLIFPIGMILNFSILFFYTLAAAMFAWISTQVLKFSVQKPISAIIYNPIEKKRRTQTITYIQGFIVPLGDFVAGAMIIGVRFFPVKNVLLFVSLGLAGGWLVINWFLKEKYTQMVLQSLKGVDYDARFEAIKIINNVKGSKVNNSLIESLNDPNPVIRSNAALALRKTKNKNTVSALMDTARRDDNKYVRAAAVQSLGEIGDTSTMDSLVDILRKEYNERVRATIISVLKDFHEEKITSSLITFLKDEDARVRANTVEVLGVLGDKSVKRRLFQILDDQNNRVRANAAIALYPWVDDEEKKELSEKIIGLLKSETQEEKASGFFVIGSVKDRNFSKYLLEGVNDKSPMVRKRAVWALGCFEDSFIVDPVIKLLGDKDYQVRDMARDVVLKRKDIFFNRLMDELSQGSSMKRVQITELLGRIGNRMAVDALKGLLKDPDEEVRLKAVVSLENLKFNDTDLLLPLLKDNSSRIRSVAIKILGKLDFLKLRGSINEMLKDEKPRVRANTIEAITDSQMEGNIEIFRKYLQDDHYRVKAAAAIAMWKNNNTEGVPVLEEMLEDEEKWVRATAVYAFGEIGSSDFIEDLLKVLNDKDLDIKRQAANALEKIGGAAVESLESFLHRKERVSEEEGRNILLNSLKNTLKIGDTEAKQSLFDALSKSDHPEINRKLREVLQGRNDILQEKLIETLSNFEYKDLLPLSLEGINFLDLNSQIKISEVWGSRDLMLKSEKESITKFVEMIIGFIKNAQKNKSVLDSLEGYKSFTPLIEELERIVDIDVQIIMNVLRGFGNRKKIDMVNKKLHDPNERIRANALDALESVGDRHIVKLFIPILEERIMSKGSGEQTGKKEVNIYEGLQTLWDIYKLSEPKTRILCIAAITEMLENVYKDYLSKIDEINDPKLKKELLGITDRLRNFIKKNDFKQGN